MRLPIHDLERPKAAAKKLSAYTPDTPLSAIQGQLAASLGYDDWHELRTERRPPRAPRLDLNHAAILVADLAGRLRLQPGDVQFALASARLIAPLALSDQLALRAAVWRRLVGPPARNKPGSVVRDRAHGRSELAYLRKYGRPTYLLFDTGPGVRGDFEVVQPRAAPPDFVPARLWLPYGCWTTRDGAEVLFSRDYLPLWRVSDRGVERLEPWLWIEEVIAERHYGGSIWATGSARAVAVDALAARGLSGLPMLVDAMQVLIESDLDTVSEAAHHLMLQLAGRTPQRHGTSVNDRLAP